MIELTVPAALEELEHVQEFVEQALEEQGISMKIQMQISIAVEEIYVNIARYAYHPEIGQATVRCAVGGNPLQVTIQFLDSGKPFDPLAKPDADTTLSAEERDIGGLGILMVKKSMDDVVYEYRDGCNILTLMIKYEDKYQEMSACLHGIHDAHIVYCLRVGTVRPGSDYKGNSGTHCRLRGYTGQNTGRRSVGGCAEAGGGFKADGRGRSGA